MMQIVEQTDEQQLTMYMKCSKEELASMLIQCNKAIGSRLGTKLYTASENYNRFKLTDSEQGLLDASGSKSVRFDTGSGIGVSVSYLNSVGVWVDITDYETW